MTLALVALGLIFGGILAALASAFWFEFAKYERGFGTAMVFVTIVGLFLCVLVAAGEPGWSDSSLVEKIASVVGYAIAAGFVLFIAGMFLALVGLVVVGLPYEAFKKVRRWHRIVRHAGSEYDDDGNRLYRDNNP